MHAAGAGTGRAQPCVRQHCRCLRLQVDCESGAALPPNYVSPVVYTASEGIQPGWGWQPYKAGTAQLEVEGARAGVTRGPGENRHLLASGHCLLHGCAADPGACMHLPWQARCHWVVGASSRASPCCPEEASASAADVGRACMCAHMHCMQGSQVDTLCNRLASLPTLPLHRVRTPRLPACRRQGDSQLLDSAKLSLAGPFCLLNTRRPGAARCIPTACLLALLGH